MEKMEAVVFSVSSCDQSSLRHAVKLSTVEDASFQSYHDRIQPVVRT
jgi:hypothetical protein